MVSTKNVKPHEIVIELTNQCNQTCPFCYQADRTTNGRGDFLSTESVFSILADIKKTGIPAVRFTGGEPFLHPALKPILEKAKELGLYTIVNTNGTLISKSSLSILRSVDLLLISFHTPHYLNSLKRKLKLFSTHGPKLILATILTAENIDGLERFYRCFSSLRSGLISDWFFLRPIPAKFKKRPISFIQLKKAYLAITSLNRKYKTNTKIANALPFCALKEDLPSICKGGRFDSGHTRIFIDSRGNYKPDYGYPRALGNINRSKISDIWNSCFMNDVRAYKKTRAVCLQCVYLNRCKGGLLSGEYLKKHANIRKLVTTRHILPIYRGISFDKRLPILKKLSKGPGRIIILANGNNEQTPVMLRRNIQLHQEFDIVWEKNSVYHAFRINWQIKAKHTIKESGNYFMHSVKNGSMLLKKVSLYFNDPTGIFSIRKEALNSLLPHPKC